MKKMKNQNLTILYQLEAHRVDLHRKTRSPGPDKPFNHSKLIHEDIHTEEIRSPGCKKSYSVGVLSFDDLNR